MTFRDEAQYRAVMKQTLDRIEKALENVDPDVAECSIQFGALTILLPTGVAGKGPAKCILSSQPSVRQLWMAVAAKGIAMHFNFDADRGVWIDDKNSSIELMSYLEGFLKEATGLSIPLAGK